MAHGRQGGPIPLAQETGRSGGEWIPRSRYLRVVNIVSNQGNIPSTSDTLSSAADLHVSEERTSAMIRLLLFKRHFYKCLGLVSLVESFLAMIDQLSREINIAKAIGITPRPYSQRTHMRLLVSYRVSAKLIHALMTHSLMRYRNSSFVGKMMKKVTGTNGKATIQFFRILRFNSGIEGLIQVLKKVVKPGQRQFVLAILQIMTFTSRKTRNILQQRMKSKRMNLRKILRSGPLPY